MKITSQKIIFTNIKPEADLVFPTPALKNIPSWYNEINNYKDSTKNTNNNGYTSGTIKKCIPVFDAMTTGYIISTHCDIYITKNNDEIFYEWSAFDAILFHDYWQGEGHPKILKNQNIPKWNNPWSIKTPKGYSCLFIEPVHRDVPLKILEGVVDTDVYSNPVLLPFTVKENFEGLVPAGTPIAQVVPFRRDNWAIEKGNKKNIEEANKVFYKLSSKFFDRYKTLFWQKKSWK
jgi:hypothetical protein